MPRKFKVAVSGSLNDRAITEFHDIGLRLVQNATGAPGYEVSVGGGLGRTPMVGKVPETASALSDWIAWGVP